MNEDYIVARRVWREKAVNEDLGIEDYVHRECKTPIYFKDVVDYEEYTGKVYKDIYEDLTLVIMSWGEEKLIDGSFNHFHKLMVNFRRNESNSIFLKMSKN